jgi:hypothetical protein
MTMNHVAILTVLQSGGISWNLNLGHEFCVLGVGLPMGLQLSVGVGTRRVLDPRPLSPLRPLPSIRVP